MKLSSPDTPYSPMPAFQLPLHPEEIERMELEKGGKKTQKTLCDRKILKATNMELLSSFPGPSFLIKGESGPTPSDHSRNRRPPPLQQALTAPFWDKPGVTPGKDNPHLLPKDPSSLASPPISSLLLQLPARSPFHVGQTWTSQ